VLEVVGRARVEVERALAATARVTAVVMTVLEAEVMVMGAEAEVVRAAEAKAVVEQAVAGTAKD
jgi:hypothetical protein